MKPVSEVFGRGLLRRVLLPGAILAVGVHPFLRGWLGAPLKEFYGISNTALFLIEIPFFGILINNAAKKVFYVFEGIEVRFLTSLAKKWNSRIVAKSREELAQIYRADGSGELSEEQERRAADLIEKLTDFPIVRTDKGARFEAKRSTRLGNIIATYELYPESRYGIDGISLWDHLRYLAPEAARIDFEEHLDLAESMILASASGIVVSVVGLSYLGGRAIGYLVPQIAVLSSPVLYCFAIVALTGGLLAAVLFYHLALPEYRETAAAFRAMTDLAVSKLAEWLERAPVPPNEELAERAERVTDYLRFIGSIPSVGADEEGSG